MNINKMINFKQLLNKHSFNKHSFNKYSFNNKSNGTLVPNGTLISKFKSSRNVFNGNGSNYLNKFNLKQFGGKNDKDFDGVLNKFDCQPGNIMRQDKTLFPNYLKQKNYKFGNNLSLREKSTIIKTLRKNPELLNNKPDNKPLTFKTRHESVIGGFGALSVDKSIPIENEEYVLFFGDSTLNQKYDPDFIEHMQSQSLTLKDNKSEIESEASKYDTAEQNALRTLSHELRHVNQAETVGNNWNDFSRHYKKNPDKFESDAIKYSKDMLLKSKSSAVPLGVNTPPGATPIGATPNGATQIGASLKMQQKWDKMSHAERTYARENYIDTDGDMKPDRYDCNKNNVMKQDSFFGLIKSKPIIKDDYVESSEYPELSNSEFINNQLKQSEYDDLDKYGKTSSYSGQKVGNVMMAADVIIPSGKSLTLAGLGIKRYVDKVKLIHTDEHDNPYIVPKVELHKKNNNIDWSE